MGDKSKVRPPRHGRDYIVRLTHSGMGAEWLEYPFRIPIPLRKDIENTLPYYELRSS